MKDTNSPDIRIKYEKFDKIITIVYSYKMGNMESSKFIPPPNPHPPTKKAISQVCNLFHMCICEQAEVWKERWQT